MSVTSAEIKTKSADVLLKMITILKELRISQVFLKWTDFRNSKMIWTHYIFSGALLTQLKKFIMSLITGFRFPSNASRFWLVFQNQHYFLNPSNFAFEIHSYSTLFLIDLNAKFYSIYWNSERSLQFLRQSAFLTCSWRFLRFDSLEQLELKFEKNIGI